MSIFTPRHAAHPERFVHGVPKPQELPPAVWINPPEDRTRVELELGMVNTTENDSEHRH